MKVGSTVIHKSHPEYGKGKIKTIQSKFGTVLVKFEKLKAYTYHLSHTLGEE